MPSSTSSSDDRPDALRPAHPLSFFDPEHVERPVPERPWPAIALAAALVVAVLTAGWEIHWRRKSYLAHDFKNTAALWAQERRKVGPDSTVLIGSSRIFFDIDLDVWEEASGRGRPVQLALEGTSPRPFLADLAKDRLFRGLVVVGVVPAIFFSNFQYRDDVLDHARDESLSQRADHLLSMRLERLFAFIDEQTRPKTIVHNLKLPVRSGMRQRFDVNKLAIHAADRNTELWSRLMDDEKYREAAKYVWAFGMEFDPPPELDDAAVGKVIEEVGADIGRIRARGGEVAFMQLPYDGGYEKEESKFPQNRFWDRLLRETDSVGVSFKEHPELQGYDLPEWSHLAPREGERYTRTAAPILYAALDARKR